MTIAQHEALKALARKIRTEARVPVTSGQPLAWLEGHLEAFGELFGRDLDQESAKVAEKLIASFDAMKTQRSAIDSWRWIEIGSGLLRVLLSVQKEKTRYESTATTEGEAATGTEGSGDSPQRSEGPQQS